MATKHCPACQNQVPVACKKCSCGHVFFSGRRKVAKVDSVLEEEDIPLATLKELKHHPRRRTGRLTREKPNFYDPLHYENRSRKKLKVEKKKEEDGKKKRRGRPPRLRAKDAPAPNPPPTPPSDEPEDVMKDISPEKALQFNIVLDDINRKWQTIAWRI